MIHTITGVILAGGKSTRMGRDKARLSYHGKNLIDAPIGVLSEVFQTVVLSVRREDDLPEYDLKKIADRYADIGPVGGIASVLQAGFPRIFCVACDMPFLNPSLIRHLCDFSEYDAVIPRWQGRAEMLHSLYSAKLLPVLEGAIAAQQFKLIDALANANVRFVEEEEIRRFDPEGSTFKNVNHPADYEKL